MTADELRERRTALGLTQAQLADELGLTRVSVMRWETGAQAISNPRMVGMALETLERRPRPDTPESVERKAAAAGAAINAALKHLG